MGQLASALGVVPGTATTMVKALAESGLVHYEPYMGVRLTAAGEKLAALVLRRHRLIEQFLVQVLGMNWSEVHDEAERLEHAVSERLIDRIDDMLGRPSVDPHGDPIPGPEGKLDRRRATPICSVPLPTLPCSWPVSPIRTPNSCGSSRSETSSRASGSRSWAGTRPRTASRSGARPASETTIGARAASKVLVVPA